MKKIISVFLFLVLVIGALTGCTLTNRLSNALEENAESTPKIEQMLSALIENRASDAKALFHPDVTDNTDAAIAQMIDYIDGREISSMELDGININTSIGTSGKIREESLSYLILMTDGEILRINTLYVSGNDKSGFATFQVVLGVV